MGIASESPLYIKSLLPMVKQITIRQQSDKHNTDTAPHNTGQKNQDFFIDRWCKFSDIHIYLFYFRQSEWLNFNFFPYSCRSYKVHF